MTAAPRVKRSHTNEPQIADALATLERELEAETASAVLLFCSGAYDLQRLGAAIAKTFAAPVAACTTAGQIGPGGFQNGGISGVSLHSPDLEMRPLLMSPLSLCQSQAVSFARQQAQRSARRSGIKSFGLMMVDGLSMWEEFVASAIYEALGNVTLVGGSAATTPKQPVAAVYHAGRFLKDAAVLAMFETSSLEFASFAVQHFVPSTKKLVITLADPERRLVYEINGESAAHAYAKALGVEESALTARHFACSPLLLDLGDQLLPRAIRARQPDGSLQMACAIEEGLVVSIGDSKDPLATLQAVLDDVERRVPEPAVLLVFDCVLRRLELEARGLDAAVGELLARRGAVGFSGFGEQLGPLHTTHTLSGIALGTRAAEG